MLELEKNALRFDDHRGHLQIFYEDEQISLKRSYSKKATFRGMHMQLCPHVQTKLIRVISGKVIDLALNVKSSGHETKWTILTNKRDWVKIDSNDAHGFYAVEDTVFEYICIGPYKESAEYAYNITKSFKEQFNFEIQHISTKDKNSKTIQVTKWIEL